MRRQRRPSLKVCNELAEQSDLVSDLLDHFSRADNWYDIYKTIELAALLVGSKHKLWPLLGSERAAANDLNECANFYRHARTRRQPPRMFTLNELGRYFALSSEQLSTANWLSGPSTCPRAVRLLRGVTSRHPAHALRPEPTFMIAHDLTAVGAVL